MKLRILFMLIFSNFLSAQTGLLNAEKPEDINKNMVSEEEDLLEYYEIEENDVLWSKVVYEFIDLNEKLNFPLLFPVDDDKNIIGRKSLWRILKEYISSKTELAQGNNLNDIEIFSSDDFTKKLTNSEVLDLMSYEQISRRTNTTKREYVKSNQIGGYNIKGMWYFDKKYSELKYRLLGIQPVGSNTEDLKRQDFKKRESPYFWIWYPTLREMLHKEMVYNDRNSATSISFDQLLISRRFNSYIYKEDNVYQNRKIGDYKKSGLQSILESERIKKEILDFEQDMWNR
ncbi:MAG: gliding motility protein GldN [Flavobacteriaceae bacterium]|nr:gliding motility protein GldN [Flavobacteriaceae bacterium]MDC1459275.1 gliding motility protein GldN [Flavobacteriaceae bacterium]MDG1967071.1 gliding motility protein GldN [Flavobacteriaceae bacterium]